MLYMYDKELVSDVLNQISDAVAVALDRFEELGITIDKIKEDL